MPNVLKVMLYPVVQAHTWFISATVKLAIKKPVKFLKLFYGFVAFGLAGWILFFIT